jgi:cysteinyl-tRNA synthetase
MLTLYNSLTKKKEEFVPIDPSEVKFYICGPTVYDFFHIGNARTFVMADILRKYLEYKGFKIKFLMNLTDIDDRIIKKSISDKISYDEVATKYSEAFFYDIKRLKLKPADLYPKATAHIEDIKAMIKKLVDSGAAYNVDGNVFYDVNKFKTYGKLSGKNIDDLEAGSRVEINEEKLNPLDFSLWKKAKEGEPYWESEWGNGRPGWHIECSAMSCRHLGETFDIHAGGNDLIFPHHENEIAQSEAANGKQFVNYWIHFGFLNINKEKMSKSLGNFFTARDVLDRYSAEAIRLFFSQAYYRGPLDFSDDLLAAAEKGLEKLRNLADRILHELRENKNSGTEPDFNYNAFETKFTEAMDDDLNTSQAVAVIFDFVKEVNRAIAENENLNVEFFKNVKSFLNRTAVGVLGIINFEVEDKSLSEDLDMNYIEQKIEERTTAKNQKNFVLADEIRNELKALGVELKDSKEGTTYKIVK